MFDFILYFIYLCILCFIYIIFYFIINFDNLYTKKYLLHSSAIPASNNLKNNEYNSNEPGPQIVQLENDMSIISYLNKIYTFSDNVKENQVISSLSCDNKDDNVIKDTISHEAKLLAETFEKMASSEESNYEDWLENIQFNFDCLPKSDDESIDNLNDIPVSPIKIEIQNPTDFPQNKSKKSDKSSCKNTRDSNNKLNSSKLNIPNDYEKDSMEQNNIHTDDSKLSLKQSKEKIVNKPKNVIESKINEKNIDDSFENKKKNKQIIDLKMNTKSTPMKQYCSSNSFYKPPNSYSTKNQSFEVSFQRTMPINSVHKSTTVQDVSFINKNKRKSPLLNIKKHFLSNPGFENVVDTEKKEIEIPIIVKKQVNLKTNCSSKSRIPRYSPQPIRIRNYYLDDLKKAKSMSNITNSPKCASEKYNRPAISSPLKNSNKLTCKGKIVQRLGKSYNGQSEKENYV